METKVSTVISYGDKPGESYRFTLNSMNIKMVVASEILVQKQEMNLYQITVYFMGAEGGTASLYISRADLMILEEAVGIYAMDDFGEPC